MLRKRPANAPEPKSKMVIYSRLLAIRLVVSVRRMNSRDNCFADVKAKTGMRDCPGVGDDADEKKVFRWSRGSAELGFAGGIRDTEQLMKESYLSSWCLASCDYIGLFVGCVGNAWCIGRDD